jgi:hypothetical protein
MDRPRSTTTRNEDQVMLRAFIAVAALLMMGVASHADTDKDFLFRVHSGDSGTVGSVRLRAHEFTRLRSPAIRHPKVRSSDLADAVTNAAKRNGVPVSLAHGVIRVESNYNCKAYNRSGATGIGQVKPATARSVGVYGNLKDCATGIEASMRYLKVALARGGQGCAGVSLYERGIYARPVCTSYGRKVIRMAGLAPQVI